MDATPPSASRWTTTLLLAVCLALGACERPAPPPPTAPPPAKVTVAHPDFEDRADSESVTARLRAIEHVDLRSRVTGFLQEVHFQDGAMVKRGDRLFSIDEREYRAALGVAEATLGEARARAELARTEAKRARTLIAKKVISDEEFRDRVATEAVAEASVRAAQAAVDRAALDVSFTRVLAPMDGRIGAAQVTAGNLVTGGAMNPTLLATLVSVDPIYAEFELSEASFLRFQALVGSAVKVRMAPTGDEQFDREGELVFIDNAISPTNGTIRLRARFANPDGRLTAGQFVRVRLPLSNATPQLLVPDTSVLADLGKRYVLLLGDDDTLSYQQVTIGAVEGGMRRILSGLKPDDWVVVEGLAKVRPGLKVIPERRTSASSMDESTP